MMKLTHTACIFTPSLFFNLVIIFFLSQLTGVRSEEQTGQCQFCKRGEITTPEKPLSIPGYEFVDSCGSIDSLAPVFLVEGTPQCDLVQSLSTLCGCPKHEDFCSFCPDGSPVPYPNRNVTWLADQFGGIIPTCELVEAALASASETDEICPMLQSHSGYCGCPPIPNHCQFCQGQPLKEEYYDTELPFLTLYEEVGITPTCELFYAAQYQVENTLRSSGADGYEPTPCFASRVFVVNCGCNDGRLYYHGTSDLRKQKFLVWLPRAVGTISLIASIMVVVDILRHPKKRKGSIYHQLVGTASIFDMITSLVWIVGPAAERTVHPFTGTDLGIYGTSGTETTCQIQAFFFQLGLTSVFLNVSLTAYFMMVVALGIREQQLRRKKLLLFGVPLLLGFTLSFAVIPFYGMAFTHCQFDVDDQPWIVAVFGLFPILGSSFSILVMLIVIYIQVRKQSRKQQKWDFGSTSMQRSRASGSIVQRSRASGYSIASEHRSQGLANETAQQRKKARKSSLEWIAFKQCLSYAAAFAVTWPFLAVSLVKGRDHDLPYGFWVVTTATAALQGFNNALCYFRLVKNPGKALCLCRRFRVRLYGCYGRWFHEKKSDQNHANPPLGGFNSPAAAEEPNYQYEQSLDPADELANMSRDDDEWDADANVVENSNRAESDEM